MNTIVAIGFLNLFFAGLLAGVEFAIHFGFRRPAEVLDETSQLRLRQALVRRLRILVPALFLPTALSAVAVTVLTAGTFGFWFRCAGVLAMLVWIWLRVIGTVPINSATLEWLPDAPPRDWKAQINRAERFHVVGVVAGVAAFALFLAATAIG